MFAATLAAGNNLFDTAEVFGLGDSTFNLEQPRQAQPVHAKRSLALNWLMCKGGLPISGANTARQALENAGAQGWRFE